MRWFLPAALAACLCWACAKAAPPEAATPAEPVVEKAPRVDDVHAVINRDYLPEVLDMIREAERRIDVIQYMIKPSETVDRITGALIQARQRGVVVRMLLDDTVRETRSAAPRLAQRGLDVKLDEQLRYGERGDKMTHNKLFIVDGRKVLVGSTNFSYSAIMKNNEANVYLESGYLGGKFSEYFERLWAEPTREPRMQACVTPTVRAIFNRQYAPAMEKLFQGAQKRIHIALYSIRPNAPHTSVGRLLGELERAHGRGVDVRVILDNSEGEWADVTNENNSAAEEWFKASGIPFRYESTDVITHAKMILVDGRVVVGGTNWGNGPLDSYNDCNVIVSDTEVVKRYEAGFKRLWKGEKYFEPAVAGY